MPVEVRLARTAAPRGEIMYQVNRTKDGWLVSLVNNAGSTRRKTASPASNRRAFTDVVLRTAVPLKSAKEYTQPRNLELQPTGGVTEIRLQCIRAMCRWCTWSGNDKVQVECPP